MYEAQKKHGTGIDQELIEVLTAISVVSKRLATDILLSPQNAPMFMMARHMVSCVSSSDRDSFCVRERRKK